VLQRERGRQGRARQTVGEDFLVGPQPPQGGKGGEGEDYNRTQAGREHKNPRACPAIAGKMGGGASNRVAEKLKRLNLGKGKPKSGARRILWVHDGDWVGGGGYKNSIYVQGHSCKNSQRESKRLQ